MFENRSGIRPVEFKVLVLPDKVEDKIGSILLPDQEKEMQQWAQVKCTLVALGAKAFEDFSEDERGVLIPGARVYVSKYEGVIVAGADGEEYKLCNDKNVAGIVENEAAVQVPVGRVPGAQNAA